jgi:hypothetical protein
MQLVVLTFDRDGCCQFMPITMNRMDLGGGQELTNNLNMKYTQFDKASQNLVKYIVGCISHVLMHNQRQIT